MTLGETLDQLLASAGLKVEQWHYAPNLTRTHLFERTLGRVPGLRGAFRALDRSLTYRFNRLLAVQFIVRCRVE